MMYVNQMGQMTINHQFFDFLKGKLSQQSGITLYKSLILHAWEGETSHNGRDGQVLHLVAQWVLAFPYDMSTQWTPCVSREMMLVPHAKRAVMRKSWRRWAAVVSCFSGRCAVCFLRWSAANRSSRRLITRVAWYVQYRTPFYFVLSLGWTNESARRHHKWGVNGHTCCHVNPFSFCRNAALAENPNF